jgi:hypothetical protein
MINRRVNQLFMSYMILKIVLFNLGSKCSNKRRRLQYKVEIAAGGNSGGSY